jgi:hypothetical protein
MSMESQTTCGQGLAEHSAVPAKLGELIAAVVLNLEGHMQALDLTDETSKKEHDAYQGLAGEYRRIATDLKATAGRMAGYRDLPMGRHDAQAMSAPKVLSAFEQYVELERELLSLLQQRVEQDGKMLQAMGGAVPGAEESPDDTPAIRGAVSTLLRELLDGAGAEACWALNPKDPGLLRSLDKLSAAAASAVQPGGGASIASHVDHLRYGLGVMNRWSEGENPFADADYSASWRRPAVSEAEWAQLRDQLRTEAQRWLDAVRRPRDLSDVELTGVVASAVHLAYHVGAIRQIDRSTRGPAATD